MSTYELPVIIEFNPVSITFQNLPSFIRFQMPTFTFSPAKKSDLGEFEVKGTVKNKYLSKIFSFKVKVTNEAPYLTSVLQS